MKLILSESFYYHLKQIESQYVCIFVGTISGEKVERWHYYRIHTYRFHDHIVCLLIINWYIRFAFIYYLRWFQIFPVNFPPNETNFENSTLLSDSYIITLLQRVLIDENVSYHIKTGIIWYVRRVKPFHAKLDISLVWAFKTPFWL